MSRGAMDIDFLIQTGVQATDYSNIVKRKHLSPVTLAIQQVEDMVKKARMELAAAVVFEQDLVAK